MADPNIPDHHGRYPADWAGRVGDVETEQRLLQRGAIYGDEVNVMPDPGAIRAGARGLVMPAVWPYSRRAIRTTTAGSTASPTF